MSRRVASWQAVCFALPVVLLIVLGARPGDSQVAPVAGTVATVVEPIDIGSRRELFIDDYLVENASRNRALDMLPVFAYLDEARIRAAVSDGLIKARPTLHYRLPNCEIEQPGWDLHPAWNH